MCEWTAFERKKVAVFQEDIVGRYDIKVMPTFIFIKNKQQVDIVEGNVEDQLRAKIAQHAP